MAGASRLTVVADTGALYALLDRDDAWHDRVASWWRAERREVRVPITVVPELTYLLQRRIGTAAELALVRGLADGELPVEPLAESDLSRTAELVEAYRDLPLGFVDASVAAIAERLEAAAILTTDRRHFPVLRLVGGRPPRLVP